MDLEPDVLELGDRRGTAMKLERQDALQFATTRVVVLHFGGKLALGNDSWESEPLDIPRDLAIEMMRWLAARAAELAQKGGAR